MFELNNKVALITGSSQGIGKAIALKYAKSGANIVINYIGDDTQAKTVANECEALGVKTLIVEADISKSDQVKILFEKTLEEFSRIDILVNNAGITKDSLMMRMTDEAFEQVIDVNLKGTYYCMKQVIKTMMKQRSGRIINMASVVGITGNAGQVNYSASKAGVIGMTKTMARELAARHITVNAIAPGFIQTDMTDILSEDIKDQLKKQIPLARLGTVDDVANVAVFLASDEANYITGQVLSIDGGMAM